MSLLEVVAGAVWDEGQLLACRRREGKSLAGYWELPGGKVELGESHQDALSRELQEELSVSVEVGEHFATIERAADGFRLICYHAALIGPRPTMSSDHDALRWLTPAESGQVRWAPADEPAIDMIFGKSGLH